jgi:hypothetical protein
VSTPRDDAGPVGGAAPLAAAIELSALGLLLTGCVSLLARLPSWYENLGRFQILVLAAFACFGLVVARLPRYARLPRVGLAVFAVAFATRMLLLPVAPSLSHDLHRYVWEGRVIVAGGDPYRQAPLDPALAPLRDPVLWPHVNHPHLSTIYPPLAEAGFALVAGVSPTVAAMKAWVVLHDLALVALLIVWAGRTAAGPVAAVAYAWNPMVLVEYAGTGHNDPTALAWLVAAFVLRDRRPVASALAFAAAVLVKLAPLVALPFLLREWPWRARIAATVPIALGLGWFVGLTRDTYSGLAAYWGTWRNNELAFHYLDRALGGYAAARTATLVMLAALAAWALWRRWPVQAASRAAIGASLLLSPVLHPWYLGWVLAFEPLGPSVGWLALSCASVFNYGLFVVPAEGRSYHLPLGARWIEYGVPLALTLAAWVLTSRRKRSAAVTGRAPGDPEE